MPVLPYTMIREVDVRCQSLLPLERLARGPYIWYQKKGERKTKHAPHHMYAQH